MACVLVLAHFLKLLLPFFDTRLQRNLESMRLMWRGSCMTSRKSGGPNSGLPTRVSLKISPEAAYLRWLEQRSHN